MKKDLHVHLYGCLSAEDLWSIGKETYQKRKSLLDWFSSEYFRAWGRKVNPSDYWQTENGFELLKHDYIFDKPASFNCFQANFNLIIALCPLSISDFSIPKLILSKAEINGLEYFEPRTLIPFRFSQEESFAYIKGLCQVVSDFNKNSSMQSKIVFSLCRNNVLAFKHYSWIRDFIRKEPFLGEEISGIDFAFAEESFPPSGKRDLFQMFHEDNRKYKRLDLLYHVGESFEDKTQVSAIRWVDEAWKLGATRLGHAIALGVDPENYRGKSVIESKEEFLQTQKWLLKNFTLFKSYGLNLNRSMIEERLESALVFDRDFIRFVYDDNLISETKDIQKSVALSLKAEGVIIESCPTSNELIGQIKQKEYHPLRFFQSLGLSYVLGTDDPGVFSLWS